MSRHPELHRVARQLRSAAIGQGLSPWVPGVAIAFLHWWIAPFVLVYSLLVSEDPATIAIALTVCVLTAVCQALYDGRCPLILVERTLLGCPGWWRGLPFSVVAAYIQPTIVFGGTVVGLVRFIINILLAPDDEVSN
jgi:hypothetical protein